MLQFDAAPLAVSRALRDTRTIHIGASRNLYHALLPTVIAQRITGHEALRQWRRLCRALGTPAPGPAAIVGDLLLPPSPEALRGATRMVVPPARDRDQARPRPDRGRPPSRQVLGVGCGRVGDGRDEAAH